MEPQETNDGIPLKMSKHPRPIWYKAVFYFFRYLFVKPKLSRDALERYDLR